MLYDAEPLLPRLRTKDSTPDLGPFPHLTIILMLILILMILIILIIHIEQIMNT